jgi:hypothetical protein
MKSTRLLASVMVAMMASMSAGAAAVISSAHAPNPIKPPKTAEPSRTTGSSRNGGNRMGNRVYQRAAMKKRNQARHRKACRG